MKSAYAGVRTAHPSLPGFRRPSPRGDLFAVEAEGQKLVSVNERKDPGRETQAPGHRFCCGRMIDQHVQLQQRGEHRDVDGDDGVNHDQRKLDHLNFSLGSLGDVICFRASQTTCI